jgi:uncharacterized protein YqjF (DUF2071 family)
MTLPLVTTAARQARALQEVAHRPWPAPAWPWSVAQTIAESASCHWPAEPAALAPSLPAGVEPDLYDGTAWVTIAAIRVTGLRVRGLLPVPRLSEACELLVRATVLAEGRPAWLVLDSSFSGALAAEAARRLYGLPAARARIAVEREGGSAGALRVEASRTRADGAPAVFHARFTAVGDAVRAAPGSLEAFLHERFLLVAGRAAGGLVAAEQHRPPWRLAPARAEVDLQTVAPPGLAAGPPALAHLAEPLDQLVWAPERRSE